MSTVTGVRDAAGVMGCHGKEDMWRHSGADLRALIPAAVTLMQQLQSLVAAGLAEVDTRGIVGSWGYTSTAAWLSNSTPLSHMEASRFAKTCSTLIRHGEVGEAFAANRFAGSHADIIARFLDDRKHIEKLAAHPEMVAAMMDVLVIDAADNDSRNLRNTVAAFTEQLADIDTDPGALPDAENVDLDEVHASVVDGRLVLRGDLNCLDAERVMNIITALSKPVPQPDGSPDPRSAGQRRADAVKQVFAWFAAHADELPSQGGRKAILDLHMNVDDFYPDPAHAAAAKAAAVADFDPAAAAAAYAHAAAAQTNRDLADLVDNPDTTTPTGLVDSDVINNVGGDTLTRRGVAATTWTGAVSNATAQRLACDSDVTRTCTVGSGHPVNVGTVTRRIPPGLRAALIARDGGCAFPACTRPAAWCEAHHLLFWSMGGPTDLHNLTLLCNHHHVTAHHRGWQAVRGPDNLPWFIPPPHVDPNREPIPGNRRGRPSPLQRI